jgi:hypothetical protein
VSGFDYTRMSALAIRLIERFGQPVTLKRTAMNGDVTLLATRGVMTDTVKHTLGDSGIAIGDDRLVLDPGVAPKPGDRIAYNGQSRVVVDPVVPINPAGTVILFECYARAG